MATEEIIKDGVTLLYAGIPPNLAILSIGQTDLFRENVEQSIEAQGYRYGCVWFDGDKIPTLMGSVGAFINVGSATSEDGCLGGKP